MMRLFMVDVENVPHAVDILRFCKFEEEDYLALFFNNSHADRICEEFRYIESVFNPRVEYINVSGSNGTKNALDFNICVYAGIAIGNFQGDFLELHIVSKDTGYKSIKRLVLQYENIGIVYEDDFSQYVLRDYKNQAICLDPDNNLSNTERLVKALINLHKKHDTCLENENNSSNKEQEFIRVVCNDEVRVVPKVKGKVYSESCKCYVDRRIKLLNLLTGPYSPKDKISIKRALKNVFGTIGEDSFSYMIQHCRTKTDLALALNQKYSGLGNHMYFYLKNTALDTLIKRGLCSRETLNGKVD